MANNLDVSGFNNQSKWAGNCAQRALIHSLLLLGIPITERQAHAKTGVPKLKALIKGTGLSSLTKAIRRCNCMPYVFEDSDSESIRNKIDEFLTSNLPVIVSANNGKHWAVLAGKASKDSYYWIDSDDSELYGCTSWPEIRDWMEFKTSYLMVGIRPKDETYFNHSIVNNFHEVYGYFDDDELAEYWGWYLEDLAELFDSPTDGQNVITAEQIFVQNSKSIIDNLFWQHGDLERNYIAWELLNYRKVASAHRFTVSPAHEREVLIGLTAAMAYTIL